LKNCEICEQSGFSLIATRIREGEGRIVRCNNCGLVIQDTDWDSEKLKEYYETEYQLSNSLVTGKEQSAQEHFDDRIKTIRSVFEKVYPLLTPDSRVLEVGCGAGELLSLVSPHVSKCVGVEMNSSFVEFIRSNLSLEAYAEDINRLSLRGGFDLIICIATLDHLQNPLETLNTMKKLLAPSGKIYIEVPNLDEALNRFLPNGNSERYREFFWHRAHLFYFDKDTIEGLLKKAGFLCDVSCRHEYTLKNFLHWYYLGKPQTDFVTGVTGNEFFGGDTEFEKRMNEIFNEMESVLKKVMAETFSGDNLCCIGHLDPDRQ